MGIWTVHQGGAIADPSLVSPAEAIAAEEEVEAPPAPALDPSLADGVTTGFGSLRFCSGEKRDDSMTCVAIWAVGFGTPPCLSKNLVESCSEYVSTIVMQDDIVPRLSVASLTRLRSEIVRTDWTDVFEKEDYKRVIDWIENAKQVLFMVQDVGQKFSQFTNFRNLPITSADIPTTKVGHLPTSRRTETEELYVPGTLFYLKKHMDIDDGKQKCGRYKHMNLYREFYSQVISSVITNAIITTMLLGRCSRDYHLHQMSIIKC
ncbi:hypothetical protein ZOSMA_4G00690 [Zostera marina]|uniref:Uncharacterized protein n=1 Tax=Zostera marina TaxID=29655 RepID=A0A0K9NYA7_ZOSMR|nr:hypothetical protein ZOSMA_4G00690 [Zostera marina]